MPATMTDVALMEARFWPKVDRRGPNECWLWIAGVGSHGYGQLSTPDHTSKELAHRYAWMLLVGPIPAGLSIDHLCENKLCMNPRHMEPVPIGVNVLRSSRAPTAKHARQTHCKHGHEFTPENTRYSDNGYGGRRTCLTCAARRARERRRR